MFRAAARFALTLVRPDLGSAHDPRRSRQVVLERLTAISVATASTHSTAFASKVSPTPSRRWPPTTPALLPFWFP
ncbi:hypothetical protein DPM19_12335 [Actinomadura craniellae]|uniref:Uncharacterized protein n=1 Tax=Actinomadura craniellae TaxID=2231787 RepID=A0A365H6A1_9ACTN|nr:hypothetical protein DPM19_12335 [Actinomadura craniellae]